MSEQDTPDDKRIPGGASLETFIDITDSNHSGTVEKDELGAAAAFKFVALIALTPEQQQTYESRATPEKVAEEAARLREILKSYLPTEEFTLKDAAAHSDAVNNFNYRTNAPLGPKGRE